MRTLNTSLPRSPQNSHANRHQPLRRRRRHAQQQQQQAAQQGQPQQPSAEVLQAFKAAALSVTQLYKTAASTEEEIDRRAREAGYQDALDDLQDFLDQEELGLGDGEGWRVREWATRRHASMSSASKGEDVGMDDGGHRETRSESPAAAAGKMTVDLVSPPSDAAEASRANSSPPASAPAEIPAAGQQQLPSDYSTNTRSDIFTFRSPLPMPPTSDLDVNSTHANSTSNPHTLRLEVLPKQARNAMVRHGHSGRNGNSLGYGAGAKRKFMLNDFFDISGVGGNGRDSGGGNGGSGAGGTAGAKKGRFV